VGESSFGFADLDSNGGRLEFGENQTCGESNRTDPNIRDFFTQCTFIRER